MSRIKSNHELTRLFHYALVLTIMTIGLMPVQASAQSCTWGGTSLVSAPDVTFLRAKGENLDAPTRLAADSVGNVYTVDPSRGKLVKIDRLGDMDRIVPDLGTPSAVAVDAAGSIFIADAKTGSVSVYDSDWKLLFQLGQGPGEFSNPNDIAIDPDPTADAVYVSDGDANLIKVYDLNGVPKFSFGGFGTAAGSFNFPSAVHVSDTGAVIVGDQNNDRVQVFDRQGVFQHCFGSKNGPGSFSLRFGRILGITTDELDRIYVADGFQGEIQVYDAAGVKLTTIGGFGSEPGQLRTPMGLVFDPFNRLWVASVNNGRTEVFGIDNYADPKPLLPVVWIRSDTYRWPGPKGKMMVVLRIDGLDAKEIDVSTVRANGKPTIRGRSKDWKLRDFDRDGVPEWRGVFKARKVLAGMGPGDVVVEISGSSLSGVPFTGTYVVRLVSDKPN